jgi:predicted dehydrogenase
VGGANIARWWHLPALKKISNTSLRAVYSTQGPRGKGFANRFGAQYCCSEFQQILDDREIDAVLIVSRNQEHASQALQALNAGKHVFVEKPMALTDEECHQLVEAVARTGHVLSVGFNRRFSPFYKEQKKIFRKRPGPGVVSCRMNSPGIAGAFWMADPAIGGAILGEACHFVDLMYWLLEAEPVSVSAYSLPLGRKDPIGENNLVAAFHFADGSIGNLTYTTVGSKTSGGERVEVFASGIGCMTEDFKRISVCGNIRHNSSKWIADKGYDPQMADFIDAIRTGRRPKVDVVDGARSTIACLRMMEAAKSGVAQTIDLAPPARRLAEMPA